MKTSVIKNWNKRKTLYFFIFLIAVISRCCRFGSVPGGLKKEEDYAAREAWLLLHFHEDSFGYHWPMYLTAWGSGMNVLNSILMIPFIAVFGSHIWVFRLPQLIVALCTVLAVEKIVRETVNEEAALWAMFLLAINPWHIMLSRWGLESNLAPGFLIFGLLFFVLGVKNEKYYLLSALFYGLSLYCYATVWLVVPFIVLFQCVYVLYVKKARVTGWTVGAGVLLAGLAIPAVLFLLVNKGIIPEITTPFLSIPKLVEMRDDDISFLNTKEKLGNLLSMLVKENDGIIWNCTEKFGFYYKIFLVFAVIGLFYCVKSVYKSLRTRNYDGYVLMGIQFLAAFVLGTLIEVNANKVNSIHISIIVFMAVGIYHVQRLLRQELKYITEMTVAGFLVLFLLFENYYFGDYAKTIGDRFQNGMEQAVRYANDLAEDGETIYIGDWIDYPKVLAFSEVSPEEYMETVQYYNYPSAFLIVTQAANYVFNVIVEGEDGIYVVDLLQLPGDYEAMGYTVVQFGNMAVLYK